MAANESTKYTHFSNIAIGTANGGGGVQIAGTQQNFDVEVVTGARTVTAADNGKVFALRAAGGAAISLPALQAGLRYRFIVGSAFASTNWVITPTDADTIYGTLSVNAADVEAAAGDAVNLVATAETIGDWVEFICDGVYWYLSGFAAAAGGITITAA